MRRTATSKEMEQGQEEMRLAQERFEKEAKEGGELPLEDSKADGAVEKGDKKARLENAPKGLPQIEGDKEGKTSPLPPTLFPAAITPAKPGSTSSAAAQPSTVEPQKELSEKIPADLAASAKFSGASESAKKVGEQTPLQSPGMPVAQTPQARGSATPEVMHAPQFTQAQLPDMIMFQSRAPWLHGDRPSRSFFPA